MSIKQIKAIIGKVKLESICIRCSKESHTYNKCSNKPHCKHDGLTHTVGDKQRCEVYKSIKQCLINSYSIHKRKSNPMLLSLRQIADYVESEHYHLLPPNDLQINVQGSN